MLGINATIHFLFEAHRCQMGGSWKLDFLKAADEGQMAYIPHILFCEHYPVRRFCCVVCLMV